MFYGYKTDSFRMEHQQLGSEAAFTSYSSLGLVISGGLFSSTNVVHTMDGLKFKKLRSLPVGLRGHCMVALDDRSLFVTAGFFNGTNEYSNKSYIYKLNEWQSKPGLPMPREGMMIM